MRAVRAPQPAVVANRAGWPVPTEVQECQETDKRRCRANMGLLKRRGQTPSAGVQGGWDAAPGLQAGQLSASVGLQTRGNVFTPLITKGSPLPAQRTEIFTTADPNQTSVKITVYQGEHRQATKNRPLGTYELTDIPPAKAGEPQIEVTFRVDGGGSLSIEAIDRKAGRPVQVFRS
jgi:molecular chaperone DnaK